MPYDTLLGRHRLLAELGHGGMADVYLAGLNGPGGFQKLSVIKIARLTDDPAFVQMFLDEARLAARLSHPNVVQTYEVGEENGRQFMVMEYLDGPSLHVLNKRAVAKGGGIDLRVMVQILSHTLDGLQYAHTLTDYDGQPLRVVHRDLTPHNLIITVQGVVKVLDFGIAKAADSRTVTQTGFYRGKLHYMSPEQAKGEPADARADIFSVGVVLAEAIRRQPFWGDSTGPIISSRLLSGDIPNIRQAGVDPQLEDICARALVADRNLRLRSATELKQRLDWYLNATGGHVSQAQLAAYVAPLFAEDRVRIRSAIEMAFKSPHGAPTSILELPKLDRVVGATPGKPVSHAMVTPTSSPLPASEVPTAAGRLPVDEVEIIEPPPEPEAPKRASYRGLIIGGVAALALALVGAGLLMAPRDAAAPAAPAPAPVPTEKPRAEEAKPVPPPPAPAPAPVVAAPEPSAIAAPPPKVGTRKDRHPKLKPVEPASPAAAVAPAPAPAPAAEEPKPTPPAAKKNDKRALDTDVFDDKKREIDRDPWKQ